VVHVTQARERLIFLREGLPPPNNRTGASPSFFVAFSEVASALNRGHRYRLASRPVRLDEMLGKLQSPPQRKGAPSKNSSREHDFAGLQDSLRECLRGDPCGLLATIADVLDLVAFDVFIHNVDRRKGNANLLMNRTDLLAIDHGDAFAFASGLIGAPDPVDDHLPKMIESIRFVSHCVDEWVRSAVSGRRCSSLPTRSSAKL
jgi:hypothetical protein